VSKVESLAATGESQHVVETEGVMVVELLVFIVAEELVHQERVGGRITVFGS
jgi:hypothetical protein